MKVKMMLMTEKEREAYRMAEEDGGYCAVMKLFHVPEPNTLVVIGSRRNVKKVLSQFVEVIGDCQKQMAAEAG